MRNGPLNMDSSFSLVSTARWMEVRVPADLEARLQTALYMYLELDFAAETHGVSVGRLFCSPSATVLPTNVQKSGSSLTAEPT